MKSAYNDSWLHNLTMTKEAKRWHGEKMVDDSQWATIRQQYACGFYHPNFVIRILLFVASLIALSGVTGILALVLFDALEHGDGIGIFCIIYGIVSLVFVEFVFIQRNHHYKSGVTEALLYHAYGFIVGGMIGVNDSAEAIILTSLIVSAFIAWRYLDLLSTLVALGSFAGFIFYECNEAGGVLQQVIPFVFIIVFLPVYFISKHYRSKPDLDLWSNVLLVVEGASLLLVYAAGNYFVVRELSESMMGLYLPEGEDIPYAYVFFALTVVIPSAYLYFGIKNKDIVLLRVSLIAIAFSVFTFKYRFSLGHPEITLTIAGAVVLGIALLLMDYLKVIRSGFTRENHLPEKWQNMNVQAVIMSQTLGGNQVDVPDTTSGGGGEFGGGGASSDF